MARVTVEDCILKIPNRFELVLMAAQRAKDISAGAPLTMERDNDKNPVIALREIADEKLSLEVLKDTLVSGLQKHVRAEETEEPEVREAEAELLSNEAADFKYINDSEEVAQSASFAVDEES